MRKNRKSLNSDFHDREVVLRRNRTPIIRADNLVDNKFLKKIESNGLIRV